MPNIKQVLSDGLPVSNLRINGVLYSLIGSGGGGGSEDDDPTNPTPPALRNKTMTVKINLNDSDPATCCTYADDAVDMEPGSADWDAFFGHYPVLFKDGQEVGKLDPNDFNKFLDGSSADITSGNTGDVMIAFPKRGLKITTDGNNIVTVSMTNNPDADASYEYLAHSRGSESRDVFYLGAYKGYKDSDNKLRSLSSKAPTARQYINAFRTQAQANGIGYEQSGFYQLTYRQCMYILKYRNLNSQSVIGMGYVDGNNSAATNTGGSERYGMDSEIIRSAEPTHMTDGKHHVKLFGLEDFWGNIQEWIDGCVTDSSRNILTANDNFNNTGSGYTNNGLGASSNIELYMSKPQGTTKTGFLAKETSGGSFNKYFCDKATLKSSCVCLFGGHRINSIETGAFRLDAYPADSTPYDYFGGRLMYL